MTYVAMWDEAVSVTFNLNGGSLYKVSYADNEEQLVNGISAIPGLYKYNVYFGMGINSYGDGYYYTVMKDGYGVWFWNTKSDGSGTWYNNGDSVLADESLNGVTLYAFYAHEVCDECYGVFCKYFLHGLGGNHDSNCPYYEDYA